MAGRSIDETDASEPTSSRRRARPPDVFRPGEMVSGTYEVRELLGSGGMGQVWEAHDVLLARRVALKAHWPHLRRCSIRKEAQALAAIRHPAIAMVHGLGRHGETEYVIMERIFGVSLAAHIARSGRMDIEAAIDVLARLADALAAVHAAGIAHRDVKPANVMLAPRDRLVLMDFGLMLPEYEAAQGSVSPGTVEYMAPEAIRGEIAPGEAWLLDVYALGVVGYEVLLGERPFDGPAGASILAQQLNARPPRLRDRRPEVPAAVAELVESCLAKDPDDRPQTMDLIASTLRGASSSRAARLRKGRSVVVVEDDPAIAEVLASIVRDVVDPASLNVFRDGETALAHLLRSPPDVLVLDIGLPGMNGVELCMHLRGTGVAESTAIVGVSAAAQPRDVELLRQLGVRRFAPKDASLLDTLERHLREALAT